MDQTIFPEFINQMPNADIPIEGLSAKLIQALKHQVVIMEFNQDVEVAEHKHEAQWGIVLEGEIQLSIDGITYNFKKGDSYFIEKDIIHSAKIKKGYKDLTFFNQVDRYKEK